VSYDNLAAPTQYMTTHTMTKIITTTAHVPAIQEGSSADAPKVPMGVSTVVVVATLFAGGGASAGLLLIYNGSRENCRGYE